MLVYGNGAVQKIKRNDPDWKFYSKVLRRHASSSRRINS